MNASQNNAARETTSNAKNEKLRDVGRQIFQEIEYSSYRQNLEAHLRAHEDKFTFCAVVTCDIEKYEAFAKRCRESRCRPPSLYAYFSRCLGVLLAEHPELIAVRHRKTLLIPSRVDVIVAAESINRDGSQKVRMVRFTDLSRKKLGDIAEEMRVRLRNVKRPELKADAAQAASSEKQSQPTGKRRLSFSKVRFWLRGLEKKWRESRPEAERLRVMDDACVFLSSTSQWMNGKSGWGVQMYSTIALSITLAGYSRRAVVGDNDEIVARQCVDVTFHFDHIVVDGAPATRFVAAFMDEVASGRLLDEY